MQSLVVLGSVVPSLLRTIIPVGIGSLLSLLVTTGVLPTPLPAEATEGVVTAVVAITIGLYYTVLRLLEQKWPAVGVLLGSPSQPVYVDMGTPVPTARAVAGQVVPGPVYDVSDQ